MSSMSPNEKNNPKKPVPEPFRELVKSMNDFFTDKPVRGFLQSIDDLFNAPFPAVAGFPVNTVETGKEHIITAELPGVKREQIHINISGNYLTITVENNELETEENDHNQVFRRKFIQQQSSRTISLPHTINDQKVKASYRDGLLRIRIPQEKGKIIEIDE